MVKKKKTKQKKTNKKNKKKTKQTKTKLGFAISLKIRFQYLHFLGLSGTASTEFLACHYLFIIFSFLSSPSPFHVSHLVSEPSLQYPGADYLLSSTIHGTTGVVRVQFCAFL